jgi:hypothetical protein
MFKTERVGAFLEVIYEMSVVAATGAETGMNCLKLQNFLLLLLYTSMKLIPYLLHGDEYHIPVLSKFPVMV